MRPGVRKLAALVAVAAAPATIGVFGGCSTSHSKLPVASPTGGFGPTVTDAKLHPTTTSLPPIPTAPPVTEPTAGAARLRSILLRPGDLPPGFAPDSDTGDELVTRRICALPLADMEGATAEVRRALTRPANRLRVIEQVDGFVGAAAAAIPLARLRALSQSCHQDGATSVTTLPPPAVGEEVAGLQLSDLTGVIDVTMVRSGPIVILVILAARGTLAAAMLRRVVQTAGTKLAVGTGG